MGPTRRGIAASAAAALLTAAAAAPALIGAPAQLTAEVSERSLTIHNIHTRETVTAVFKRGGRYDQAGLEKLNQVMRDHRRNEARRMDPALIDLLWQMHAELGSREPIHLVSGYRSKASNEMLRRSNGGQARESRHILGKAADVHFPDVPVKRLRYSALVQERGGVGYYPTSALPFVHVDTDRVRSWPRLPRHELALLFPDGRTRHAPADGGRISTVDVRVAQVKNRNLAHEIGLFHVERRHGTGAAVAAVAEARPAALPPTGRMALPPRTAFAPAPALLPGPSAGDRARLAELVSLASMPPRLVAGPALAPRPIRSAGMSGLTGGTRLLPRAFAITADTLPPSPTSPGGDGAAGPGRAEGDAAARFVPAPAYDDEHPEEIAYRPFPIGPYLTETAGEPLLDELVAHDVALTMSSLEHPESMPLQRLRHATAAARVLWSQQFTGAAVAIDWLRETGEQHPPPAGVTSRPVRTSRQ